MTPIDVSRVLAKAAAYDRRKVGEAEIFAWMEALGDIDVDDAVAAVARHYHEQTEWLMPAHVVRIVTEVNRKRADAERSEQLRREWDAIETVAAEPARDRSPEVKAMLEELARRLGPGRPEAFRRPEWLENDRRIERERRAEPNPAYTGPPPQGGHPIPEEALP